MKEITLKLRRGLGTLMVKLETRPVTKITRLQWEQYRLWRKFANDARKLQIGRDSLLPSIDTPADAARSAIRTYRMSLKPTEKPRQYSINGLHYKADEVGRCIRNIIKDRRMRTKLINDKLAKKQPNGVLKTLAIRRSKDFFKSKKPTDNRIHIGIEIEMTSPISNEELAGELAMAYPSMANYTHMKHDSSIRADTGFIPVELAICAPYDEFEQVITAMCKVLNRVGCKVNKSCGLHVHLDQRGLTTEQVAKNFTNLATAEKFLMDMQPESRKGNQYCHTLYDAEKTNFTYASQRQRYRTINATAFHKYGTLEIRLAAATIQSDKIISYVKLYNMLQCLTLPATFRLDDLKPYLDAQTLEFCKERLLEHSGDKHVALVPRQRKAKKAIVVTKPERVYPAPKVPAQSQLRMTHGNEWGLSHATTLSYPTGST